MAALASTISLSHGPVLILAACFRSVCYSNEIYDAEVHKMKNIDMHAHCIAPEFVELVEKEGARHNVVMITDKDGRRRFSVAGRSSPPLPPAFFSPLAKRFTDMQERRIDMQVISTQVDLSGYNLAPHDGLWFCTVQNESLAHLAQQYPEKLAAMATVPLQEPTLAAQELKRAIDTLHMHGVEIGTSVNNVYLDDAGLDVFWAAAQELDVPIFLHPLDMKGMERLEQYYLNILIGFPTETSIAAPRLSLSGVLDRFPHLKICLAHAGGFLPYLFGRLDRGYEATPMLQSVHLNEIPSRYLQCFYFDTIAHSQAALDYLYTLVGPQHILLGTDYPFEIGDPHAVEYVQRIEHSTAEEIAMISGNNAASLFHL
jgi:aminocarboxymuconate-semialdehyde decarboxylase